MNVTSEMMANVWKVEVNVNDQVEAGQILMILESMKMEIPVEAPIAGVVVELAVAEGESVEDGQLLARVE
jgi:acetyl-CoA carboxylase biotin carboxyl carrier protein